MFAMLKKAIYFTIIKKPMVGHCSQDQIFYKCTNLHDHNSNEIFSALRMTYFWTFGGGGGGGSAAPPPPKKFKNKFWTSGQSYII